MKETLTASQNNEEKYISFSEEVVVDTDKDGKDIKQQLRFIDSFRFVASSVDKLESNLEKGCCVNTSKYYRGEQLTATKSAVEETRIPLRLYEFPQKTR